MASWETQPGVGACATSGEMPASIAIAPAAICRRGFRSRLKHMALDPSFEGALAFGIIEGVAGFRMAHQLRKTCNFASPEMLTLQSTEIM